MVAPKHQVQLGAFIEDDRRRRRRCRLQAMRLPCSTNRTCVDDGVHHGDGCCWSSCDDKELFQLRGTAVVPSKMELPQRLSDRALGAGAQLLQAVAEVKGRPRHNGGVISGLRRNGGGLLASRSHCKDALAISYGHDVFFLFCYITVSFCNFKSVLMFSNSNVIMKSSHRFLIVIQLRCKLRWSNFLFQNRRRRTWIKT